MKAQRIYVDTSVVGGCFDPEFAPWSNGLLKDFRLGVYLPVVSDVVATEIAGAPPEVRSAYHELLMLGAEVLSVSDDVVRLADIYQARKSSRPSITMMVSTSRWRPQVKWTCS